MECKRLPAVIIACMSLYVAGASAASAPGFLTPQSAPDSLAILPPPPPENSVTFLADKAQYETGRTLIDKFRQQLAASDADYKNFATAFSSAFGVPISETQTPALSQLLQNVLQDSHDFAMRAAKDHYQRVRPFVMYKDSTCTPAKDKKMAKTGSYPSGHASFGWATALVLAEINPARQTAILRRGYEFGQSRVVCGAHWQSDVDSGRIMGAAVVAALHANEKFAQEMAAAKREFASLNRGTGAVSGSSLPRQ